MWAVWHLEFVALVSVRDYAALALYAQSGVSTRHTGPRYSDQGLKAHWPRPTDYWSRTLSRTTDTTDTTDVHTLPATTTTQVSALCLLSLGL